MPYSEITEGDKKEIEINPFVEDTVLELDSVTVRMRKEYNVKIFTIMTNEIGGFFNEGLCHILETQIEQGEK